MNIELYECTRLNAKLTQKHCETNRSQGRIFACDGCPGLGAASSISIAPPPPQIKDEKENTMAKGTCTTCGRPNMSLPIKDTCGKCYTKKGPVRPVVKAAATPPRKVEKAAPQASEPAAPTSKKEQPGLLYVHFDISQDAKKSIFRDDQPLLELITAAAKQNRRTVSGEILYRLDRSFEA
jgi:hypothetical protein